MGVTIEEDIGQMGGHLVRSQHPRRAFARAAQEGGRGQGTHLRLGRRVAGARGPGCKFSQLNRPPRLYPCLGFTESLAVSAQDSGPSGSLLLSRKNFAFSA